MDNIKEKYDVYEKIGSRYETHHGKTYQWHSMVEGEPPRHFFASVSYSQGFDEVKLHPFFEVPHIVTRPTAFWEVLHSFKNQSLWRYFHFDGDGIWIHRGLIMGSLVIAHDGSCMKYVVKDVFSAAFMIYDKVTKQ